ncbi:cytochrome c oxidase subunit 2A [Brevibacillus agri]|uniref:cytochrome c oxidase subunit 2A n=1 Tax=Brevibacillus agri TaxID=51101 RepID=UPI0025B6FC3C|nr:cytochrome c oxidase subunit 2A [Brevibacillus agri]MDN4094063.1 cytochrome c oxidase subunit 2A [Brevibacillus agri]
MMRLRGTQKGEQCDGDANRQIETRQKIKRKKTQPEQEELKGTFAAVLIVGGIILVGWLGVFGLFLDRA